MAAVRTVVLGPLPPPLEAFIEQRRIDGLDGFDEVWEGEYHMVPASHPSHGIVDQELAVLLDAPAKAAGLVGTGPFNLGTADDYRVPDRGLHRGRPTTTRVPTAAVVVEIVSPEDESRRKFGFYAAHGVDEILIVDPGARIVEWHCRRDDSYLLMPTSALLGITGRDIHARIDWPPT